MERSAGIVKQCYFHFVIACGMDFVGARAEGLERHRETVEWRIIKSLTGNGTLKALREEVGNGESGNSGGAAGP